MSRTALHLVALVEELIEDHGKPEAFEVPVARFRTIRSTAAELELLQPLVVPVENAPLGVTEAFLHAMPKQLVAYRVQPQHLRDRKAAMAPVSSIVELEASDAELLAGVCLLDRGQHGQASSLQGLSAETGIDGDMLRATLERLGLNVPDGERDVLVLSESDRVGLRARQPKPLAPQGAWSPSKGASRDALLAYFATHGPVIDRRSASLAVLNECMQQGVIEGIGRPTNYYRLTARGEDWYRDYRFDDKTWVVAGERLSPVAAKLLRDAAQVFRHELDELNSTITHMLGENIAKAPRIMRLEKGLECIARGEIGDGLEVTDVLEVAFLACKGEIVKLRAQREDFKTKVKDASLLRNIDESIAALDRILRASGFAKVRGKLRPRVTDFINIGAYRSFLAEQEGEEPELARPSDEKFGILNAPSLFGEDFRAQKSEVFERGRSLAVAFVDIDKFKQVNTTYAEAVVDRDILPPFMRALDGFCHGRARAYRQGGDEYLVLLNNADADEALRFFDGLRAYLAKVEYPANIEARPKVSIGIHVATPIDDVTVLEAVELANLAKNAAKEQGRDCCRLSTAEDFLAVTNTILAEV